MEMAIVISIITVLALLLVPSLKKTGDQVKGARCMSNLHQIYLLSMQYANDNEGALLYSIGSNPSVDPYRTLIWDRMLQTYSGAKLSVNGSRPFGIYACPASATLVANATSSSSDYGKNAFINGNYLTVTVTYKVTSLTRPAEIILFGDGSRDLWGHTTPYNLNARHGGKANIVYADGHGAQVDPATLPSSDLPFPPWFP